MIGDKEILERIKYEKYFDKNFNWTDIDIYISPLDIDFLRMFKDKIDWILLSSIQDVPHEFKYLFSQINKAIQYKYIKF